MAETAALRHFDLAYFRKGSKPESPLSTRTSASIRCGHLIGWAIRWDDKACGSQLAEPTPGPYGIIAICDERAHCWRVLA
jgi:hypothetical protein